MARDWRDDKIEELERAHAEREARLELERDVLRAESGALRTRLADAQAKLAAISVEVELPARLSPEPEPGRVDERELRHVLRARGVA